MTGGDAPPGSGRRASGVAMTLFLSCLLVFLFSPADDDRRAAALVVRHAQLRELSSGSVPSLVSCAVTAGWAGAAGSGCWAPARSARRTWIAAALMVRV